LLLFALAQIAFGKAPAGPEVNCSPDDVLAPLAEVARLQETDFCDGISDSMCATVQDPRGKDPRGKDRDPIAICKLAKQLMADSAQAYLDFSVALAEGYRVPRWSAV
jgi:hypothetical protein